MNRDQMRAIVNGVIRPAVMIALTLLIGWCFGGTIGLGIAAAICVSVQVFL